MTSGPIVIVDADADLRGFYADVINAIGVPNETIFFDDSRKALEYLYTTDDRPFIILSEINLPGENGLEMKKTIQKDDFLQKKSIPFVFISTDTSPETVRKAHLLNVQGYFEKPRNLVYVEQMLIKIFEYWELSKHINNT